ncbi:lipoyl(octanoyl) transferase [archaeon]|nr:MAG: lipoyl(octanoyl) transferase [archaeon]
MPWAAISLLFVLYFVILPYSSGWRDVRILDFSNRLVPYKDAWIWQQKLVQHHIDQRSIDKNERQFVGTLLILQHSSVYTLGTATTGNSGPFSFAADDGSKLQYETFQIDRAGQATYHGPGQLVCYPIFDLQYFEKDIHCYLRNLEEVIIRTLARYNIEAHRKVGLTGVWVGDNKLAALGIKLRRWVTMHGLALNVNPELRYFDNIVPCGIQDKSVGSMCQLVSCVDLQQVKNDIIEEFGTVFGCDSMVLPREESEAIIASLLCN